MEVVTGAMGSLLPMLGQLLMDEYNLHKRVKKDVEFLWKELESMHAALIKVGEVPRDQLDRQVKLFFRKRVSPGFIFQNSQHRYRNAGANSTTSPKETEK